MNVYQESMPIKLWQKSRRSKKNNNSIIMSGNDYPNPEEQHLPHEAWHVVQQKVKRRNHPEGAQFAVYISPSNNTDENLTEWEVTISQGIWSDTITSNNPEVLIQSPGLSGEFGVVVRGTGPQMSSRQLTNISSESGPNVNCSVNCSSLIVLRSTDESGTDTMYYTLSNTICD